MTMPNPLLDIRIGTMVRANLDDPAAYVRQILPLGFESIQPFFWQTLGGKDIPRLAGEIREAIGKADVVISSIGVFGNPLEDGDKDREVLAAGKRSSTTRICSAPTPSAVSPAASAASH